MLQVIGETMLTPLLCLLLVCVSYLLLTRLSQPHGTPPFHTSDEESADDVRAEALLAELLTVSEYAQIAKHGYLDVRSPNLENRVYRVPRRRGAVQVYDSSRLQMSLCVDPLGTIPEADIVLIHKLMIEDDEEKYLRFINSLHADSVPLYI